MTLRMMDELKPKLRTSAGESRESGRKKNLYTPNIATVIWANLKQVYHKFIIIIKHYRKGRPSAFTGTVHT